MIRSVVSLVLAGAVILGCRIYHSPNSNPSNPTTAAKTADIYAVPPEVIGHPCVVRLVGKGDSMGYEGTIVAVNEDSILLKNAVVTRRIERSPSLTTHIPYVSRLFKNTAIGRQTLDEDVQIPRAEIGSIEMVAE